jgi:hypothetical protein
VQRVVGIVGVRYASQEHLGQAFIAKLPGDQTKHNLQAARLVESDLLLERGRHYASVILMKKAVSRKPPTGAPEGTTWFGGPVDRWKVALRVYGQELDPDRVSALLCCEPSSAALKGTPFPKKGRWILEIDSKECGENDDVDDGIRMLLARLPSDPDVWVSLANIYNVDVFCALFITAPNRGFGITTEVSRLLSDRGLQIGFDLYLDPLK